MELQKTRGSLKTGRVADITLLDKDIFKTSAAEILRTKPATQSWSGRFLMRLIEEDLLLIQYRTKNGNAISATAMMTIKKVPVTKYGSTISSRPDRRAIA